MGRYASSVMRSPRRKKCEATAAHATLRRIQRYARYGFSIMGGLPHDGAGAAAGPVDADRTDCSPIYISSIKPNAPSDGKVKVRTIAVPVSRVCGSTLQRSFTVRCLSDDRFRQTHLDCVSLRCDVLYL